jgi:methylated-DNA-protein-cysteine methyltransferase-like protein
MTLTATDRAILEVIRAIPEGEVRGYGEVARLAGLPRGARRVARLLSAQHDDLLPWHRVLRSDGRIAFLEGSEGHLEQVRRLCAEGVVVTRGRVRRETRAVIDDLDALLWAPPR